MICTLQSQAIHTSDDWCKLLFMGSICMWYNWWWFLGIHMFAPNTFKNICRRRWKLYCRVSLFAATWVRKLDRGKLDRGKDIDIFLKRSMPWILLYIEFWLKTSEALIRYVWGLLLACTLFGGWTTESLMWLLPWLSSCWVPLAHPLPLHASCVKLPLTVLPSLLMEGYSLPFL